MAASTRWPWQRRQPKLGPLIGAADRAMAERRWRDAAALYEQVLAQRPGLSALRIQLAHACKELGWLDAAASHYTEAARSQPRDVDPLLHLGHMARAADDSSGAAEWYRRALAIDPACAAALSGLQAVVDAGSAPAHRRRHIESLHFASATEACRIHWDLSPPTRRDAEHGQRFIMELGRALAARCEWIPVRFAPERGRYERCGAGGEPVVDADLAMPANLSLLVTSPGRFDPGPATARALAQAQAQLRARIVTLVHTGFANADMPLIADSSCILAPPALAAALRDNQWRLGAHAESVLTIEAAEPVQGLSTGLMRASGGSDALEPWIEVLDDLRRPGRLAMFAGRPLRRLVDFGRFHPLSAFAGNSKRPMPLAGDYLTVGAGWNAPEPSGTDAREVRVFGAGPEGDPLVCRVMLRRNSEPAGPVIAAEWRTLHAEAPGSAPSDVAAGETVFDLGAALADVRTAEIAGFVFHPCSQDHHWFEFIDRLSRHAEPMAIGA